MDGNRAFPIASGINQERERESDTTAILLRGKGICLPDIGYLRVSLYYIPLSIHFVTFTHIHSHNVSFQSIRSTAYTASPLRSPIYRRDIHASLPGCLLLCLYSATIRLSTFLLISRIKNVYSLYTWRKVLFCVGPYNITSNDMFDKNVLYQKLKEV